MTKCRFCNHELKTKFVDLINAPPSNSFIHDNQLNDPEVFYPLKLYVCDKCFLVQIDEYKKSDEIFNQDYAYFSSYSSSWLKHAKEYVTMITDKLSLNNDSLVVEIASNDGYLLQYFHEKKIPCIGIEPTKNTAQVAKQKGIKVIEDFFNADLAKKIEQADLILGNNVIAHVPDINDFVHGLKIALKKGGTITMEFPHLLRLIKDNQFDTIYHEHFSYYSLYTIDKIFKKHGLDIYDVDELTTHGGSLRIYAQHSESNNPIAKRISDMLKVEGNFGLLDVEVYKAFQEQADAVKYNFLSFLINAKQKNRSVVGYGAAAKGNTLLNYCGVKKDLILYVVDKSPHKQNKLLPGSHIPVVSEDEIVKTKPDYVIIFPWNIKEEIVEQLLYVREWGCKFVIAIPHLELL